MAIPSGFSPFSDVEQRVVDQPLAVQGFYQFTWSSQTDPTQRVEVAFTDNPMARKYLVEVSLVNLPFEAGSREGPEDDIVRFFRVEIGRDKGETLLRELGSGNVPLSVLGLPPELTTGLMLRPDLTELHYRADDRTKAAVRMSAQPDSATEFVVKKSFTQLRPSGEVVRRERTASVATDLRTMLEYFRLLVEQHRNAPARELVGSGASHSREERP